jgi:hypothetical protein
MATIRRIATLRLRQELVDATDGLRFKAETWTDTLAPFTRIRTETANEFAGLYRLQPLTGIVEKHYGGRAEAALARLMRKSGVKRKGFSD